MSDMEGSARGRSRKVSGSIVVGRGRSMLPLWKEVGEKGPVGIEGDGQVIVGRWRLKLRMLRGERGPPPMEGEIAV